VVATDVKQKREEAPVRLVPQGTSKRRVENSAQAEKSREKNTFQNVTKSQQMLIFSESDDSQTVENQRRRRKN
jgi:2-methylcitrate dehydratase PrpD